MKIGALIDERLQLPTLSYSQSRATGLIHPKGKILICDFFNHLQTLIDHPEFLTESLKETVENMQKELREDEEYRDNLINNDEHPEWHAYEMLQADLQDETLSSLYNSGYLRFYIHFKNERGQTFGNPQIYANITLEGKADKMSNHLDLISYLQNKYRVRLKIEKR